MYYFDYTATTPIDDDVLNTYIKVQQNYFANINSLHKLGQISNVLYTQASEEIKMILNSQHRLIFTSNASEANNIAIQGIAKKHTKGKIITSSVEHPSVFYTCQELEKAGYEVVYLPVDKKGVIDIEELKRQLDKDTILVSLMWVNNIVGAIEPINEVIKLVKKFPKAKLHVDMVQGFCKLKFDFNINDIDLITVSIHKIYGPKGVGILFLNPKLTLEKVLYGTANKDMLKPGTLDLALAVASCKAIKKFYPLIEQHYNYVSELNILLRNGITNFSNIHINSSIDASPYIVNLSFLSVNAETVVHYLEKSEIYVSTGSACSSKLKKPEKTIYAMTNDNVLSTNAIRISFSHLTTKEEVLQLIKTLGEINNV